MSRPVLWDLPTRLFHWLVVFLLPLSWLSAETQNFDVHQLSGSALLVLVVARVIWGFFGSAHSRFSDFLVGPRKVLAYLRTGADDSVGHNPLGGWSVLVLLSLLFLQALSGLFNSDDIFFTAPLHYGAPETLRNVMGEIHDWCFNTLLGFVALHIIVVLYHQLRLRERLVQAMLFGKSQGREGLVAPVGWWWALVVLVLLAALLWWGLEQAPKPEHAYWLEGGFESF